MSRRKNRTLRAGLLCGVSAWTGAGRAKPDKTLADVSRINKNIRYKYTVKGGGKQDE